MKPTISFEYFPPKSAESEAILWDAIPALSAVNPKFMTVTYGAGGSTKDKTLEIAGKLAAGRIPIASHLTFLTTVRDDLETYIDNLWAKNIRHIVALRGDLPKGKTFDDFKGDSYFRLTSDFVAHLKSRYDFDISVAAYPEKHPDAKSLKDDIAALKLKCEAGADRAITQFFFENEKFYDFLEQCEAAGIKTPIYPGLVPVHDFKSLVRFAANCQANVPQWLHEKFAKVEGKPEDAHKLAVDLLTEQTMGLADHGVEHFHFYTLNKAPITLDACKALGY